MKIIHDKSSSVFCDFLLYAMRKVKKTLEEIEKEKN
jgi:hypothetical protein